MRLYKTIFAWILLWTSFLTPYFIWEKSMFRFLYATLGILIAAIAIYGRSSRRATGLEIKATDFIWASILGVLVYMAAKELVPYLTSDGIASGFFLVRRGWEVRIFFQFFQVLNEEIVLRALLLTAIVGLSKNRELLAITLAALCFSILHYVLYSSGINHPSSAQLHPMVLLNLFLFGMVCNWSYLIFGNISYALALHAGWNLFRFSGDIRDRNNHVFLSEPQTFNVIEASWLLTIFIALVFIILIFIVRARKIKIAFN